MKSAILHVRWIMKGPARMVFGSVEDAVRSAHVMCANYKVQPEGVDWENKLKAGKIVGTSGGFTLEVEEVEFHHGAIETDLALPEPQPVLPADYLCQFVLMRKDVPDYLSGKAQAQSNHAGSALIWRAYRSKDKKLIELVDEWAEEGDGFGTCIVKEVTSAEMRQTISYAKLLGLYAGPVHDSSYPLRDGDQIVTLPIDTCGFIFGMKSACDPLVRRFPLLKEAWEK